MNISTPTPAFDCCISTVRGNAVVDATASVLIGAHVRVERAFAFTDLSGFTGFTHRNGDEAARDVLTQFRGVVRNVVDDHGIRVSKWLGDGAMIVSVDLGALVAALIQMHNRMAALPRTLPIRSGVTVGNVMVFEGDDYIGSTVNLASRLCDAAADNEILAHAIVAGRLGSAVTTVSLGSRSLPGIGSAIEVVKILTADDESMQQLARTVGAAGHAL